MITISLRALRCVCVPVFRTPTISPSTPVTARLLYTCCWAGMTCVPPPRRQAPGLLSAAHPLWKPLCAPLLPQTEVSAGNWLTGASAAATSAAPAPCVVGEWVFVEIDVENPMHVQLGLSQLQLKCTLDQNGADAASAETAANQVEAIAKFEVDTQEVLLPPGRRSLVRLGVRALDEGQLTIDGVTWTLNGVAHGSHRLELHGRRLNRTKAERTSKSYAFDQSLKMRAVAAMPLLQARIDGLPQTMLLGEFVRTTLVLSNVGRSSVCEAKLRLSQPAFCVLLDDKGDGNDGTLDSVIARTDGATTVCTERPRLSAEGSHHGAAPKPADRKRKGSGGPDYSVHTLPLPAGELKPGDVLQLPLWVRAAALGAHALHFVFSYVPSMPSSELKRRLCPLSAKLRVHPSLAVKHVIMPLAGSSRAAPSLPGADFAAPRGNAGGDSAPAPEYALSLQVQNVATAKRLQVTQVSCVSSTWETTMLYAPASPPAALRPTEANAVHLRVAPREATVAPPPAVQDRLTTTMAHCEILWGGASVRPTDSRGAPHLELLLRTDAPAVTEADAHSTPVAYIRPTSRRKPLSAAEVAATDGLALIIHWADADGPACGQLHVTGLQPQPRLDVRALSSAPSSASAAAAGAVEPLTQALRVTVEAADTITHQFGLSSLCHVPLRVIVQNCLRDTSLAFTLHVTNASAAASTTDGTASQPHPSRERLPSGGCVWLGCTRHAERWLPPASTTSLSLTIAVTTAGIYTLDGFRVAVTAWKPQGTSLEQRPHELIECPSPATRSVMVIAG